jgi:hypothetical protein
MGRGRRILLHREEGIDLRLLQPQRRASGVVGEMPPPLVSRLKPPAVGSISMKSGLNVDAGSPDPALI